MATAQQTWTEVPTRASAFRDDILQTRLNRSIPTWATLVAELDELQLLQSDWDGQGASAPLAITVQTARHFLRLARSNSWPCPYAVRATPDGCIAFHWTMDTGDQFEAEVSRNVVDWIMP
jgi:hypothetical protein